MNAPGRELQDISFAVKPFDHQLEAYEISKKKKVFAFLCEMGTGKSKMLLDNIGFLAKNNFIDSAIILAPKGVYMNWVNKEIPEHFTKDIPYKISYWNPKYHYSYKPGLFQFFIINIEAFRGDKIDHHVKFFLSKHKPLVAVDESTHIKTRTAKQTKKILKLGSAVDFKRILTGSPVTNSPLDLFSQFGFLSPSILGFRSFTAFKAHYAISQKKIYGQRSFDAVVGYQNTESLIKSIDPYCYKKLKSECLDLPPMLYQKIEVEPTDSIKDAYNSMATSMECLFPGPGETMSLGAVSNAISKIQKLSQITNGFLYYDEIKEDTLVKKVKMINAEEVPPKLAAMTELIDSLSGDKKVIIWSHLTFNIKMIISELVRLYGPGCVVHFFGETTDDERKQAIELFQDPKSSVRFFVGNPSVAGFGLTLTAAEYMIFMSNSYSIENRQQAEARAHRIGQTKNLTVIDIVMKESIDQAILEALEKKVKIQDLIMNNLGKLIKRL